MGMYKGTQVDEPGTHETLYFIPSWHSETIFSQRIAVAALEGQETSIIGVQYFSNDKEYGSNFVHFILTEQETELLINALLEVRNRWKTGNVVKEG